MDSDFVPRVGEALFDFHRRFDSMPANTTYKWNLPGSELYKDVRSLQEDIPLWEKWKNYISPIPKLIRKAVVGKSTPAKKKLITASGERRKKPSLVIKTDLDEEEKKEPEEEEEEEGEMMMKRGVISRVKQKAESIVESIRVNIGSIRDMLLGAQEKAGVTLAAKLGELTKRVRQSVRAGVNLEVIFTLDRQFFSVRDVAEILEIMEYQWGRLFALNVFLQQALLSHLLLLIADGVVPQNTVWKDITPII